ncbi:MAG: L-histidine N(alpha)-methyltransferase [Bradymonadaceae bacterium]
MLDFEPEPQDFQRALIEGLVTDPKVVPSKFLYDERGSELFERICELDEYYPTDAEMAIFDERLSELADAVGAGAQVVEYGSGSGRKTVRLLRALERPAAYIPIDISRAALETCRELIADRVPEVPIRPVCADYTRAFDLPDTGADGERTVAFFPGSTIGNFKPEEAVAFLRNIARTCGPESLLLIGVDLAKDPDVLRRAYDDSEGVTAEFNLNLLDRANREADAGFDRDAFRHRATYDDDHPRIVLQLVSERDQRIEIGDEVVEFDEDEAIDTEYSYKYEPQTFRRRARRAGWRPATYWTDPEERFSFWVLEAEGPA